MYINKTIILCFLFIYGSRISYLNAQDAYFKVSGQYRVRPEFRHGYRTLATDSSEAAFFVAQRARLAFEYNKDKINIYTSIQDVRTWGDEEQQKDLPGLQVNELWLELALKKGFSLKMGRQELAYDDHRLLGNVDWSNTSRSHDALLLKYLNKEKELNWHLGGAFNQSGEPIFGTNYNLNNYNFLGFTWLKKGFSKAYSNVSAIAILNGLNSLDATSTSPKASFTLGSLYNYQHNKWKGIAGGYYQGGKTAKNQSISAFMTNVYGEYRSNKFFGGIGLDYLSGSTDNTPTEKTQCFSTLYATNHKFYGYMDYFLSIPTDTKQRGLMDAYLRLGTVPCKNVTTTLEAHYFALANESAAISMKKNLGTELDLLLEYKPTPIINLQLGYSMLFATSNMELLKGGSAGVYNGWAFAMLKVSPTFFTHEFKN